MSKIVDKINNLKEGTAIVISIVDDVHNTIDIVLVRRSDGIKAFDVVSPPDEDIPYFDTISEV